MSILHRKYKNYKEYLSHQKNKLNIGIKKKIKKFSVEAFDDNVRSFILRIKKFKKYVKGEDVLCLGARLGHEVKAFRDLGFQKTIGIDLNPGKNNIYVSKGDFHKTKFEDNSFDTIYTNSIDHAWDIKLLSKEMARILRSDGIIIFEVDHLIKKSSKRRREWIEKPSKYESLIFDSVKDIDKSLKGFKFIKSFNSEHHGLLVVIFKKSNI
jgi:SAM-dependent methyltransferase